MRALVAGDVPTVLVTRGMDDGSLPFVAGDDALGVSAAVEHLAELGHTRIAHLTGPGRPPDDGAAPRGVPGAAAAASGIVRHGDAFTIETGRVLAGELLATRRASDRGPRRQRHDRARLPGGVRGRRAALPEDISLVGHNDMPLVERVQPPLTTVSIPQREIGAEAARMLLARMHGEAGGAQRRLLPTHLVVRASTAPPRRPELAAAAAPVRVPGPGELGPHARVLLHDHPGMRGQLAVR